MAAKILQKWWVAPCHLHRLGGPVEAAPSLTGSPAARGRPAALHGRALLRMAEAACLPDPHCWPATQLTYYLPRPDACCTCSCQASSVMQPMVLEILPGMGCRCTPVKGQGSPQQCLRRPVHRAVEPSSEQPASPGRPAWPDPASGVSPASPSPPALPILLRDCVSHRASCSCPIAIAI